MEIKRWDTGAVIISGDETSLIELVVRAVKEKKNLYGADLSGAAMNMLCAMRDCAHRSI